MKKVISVILAVCMFMCFFIGCSSELQSANEKENPQTQEDLPNAIFLVGDTNGNSIMIKIEGLTLTYSTEIKDDSEEDEEIVDRFVSKYGYVESSIDVTYAQLKDFYDSLDAIIEKWDLIYRADGTFADYWVMDIYYTQSNYTTYEGYGAFPENFSELCDALSQLSGSVFPEKLDY